MNDEPERDETMKQKVTYRLPAGRHGSEIGRGRGLSFLLGATSLAVVGFLAFPTQAVAAEDDTSEVRMGFEVWQANGCSTCHGNYGEGGPGGKYPQGPSLRDTDLDRDGIAEIIQDGRNQMPSFADSLSAEEIDYLLEYLMTWVVGAGEVSVEDCEFQRGEGHRICERLQ